ncbi:response regulator [Rubrivirga sp. IMCC45206]|uniref:hybrid sensor histidine kinase/response regulator n=1 Tax=Rubrivirga sp. IMCC45206 TaxID=3391614 RepID=UPI0039902970
MPDDAPLDLRAHRATILLGAIAVPAFWVLDQMAGLAYDDPLEYRLAITGIAVLVLALTYVDDRVRRHIRVLMVGVIYLIAAYFSWTAARNGLPAPWAAGLSLLLLVCGLVVALYAPTPRAVAGTLAGLAAALLVPVALTPPPAGGFVLPYANFVAVVGFGSAALYGAGVTRLKMLAAVRESRDALAAQRDAVVASERLLRTVIDTIPDHIYVKDREGRATLRNVASATALGYADPGESVGETILDADLPAEYSRAVAAADLRVVRTGRPIENLEEQTPDGDWLLTTKVPLRAESGEVVGLVGVSRDVSDQKRAAVALVAAKEAAEAATRAKSEFLANMSHEIRTPMNGVVGMTSLLLETPLGPEQRDFVETIRTSGDALLTIINDILDFSKIEAGMLSLEEAPFDVASTVEDALDLVAQGAAEKGVELAYVVGDGAPRAVVGDVTRVRQVLVNLLSNAVKFTAEGSVCVRVGGAPPDAAVGSAAELTFAVEDTGIGIAPGKLEAVFESFSQADASTTREYGGTGLGLAICRSLVGMMDGRLGAESVPGVGSTFRFSIPAVVAPAPSAAFVPSAALDGPRVLVALADAVVRATTLDLVASWGLEATGAPSGDEAIAIAARAVASGTPFDTVVLDMQTPGMDGHEVAAVLGSLPSPSPAVVGLTGVARTAAARSRAAAAGVTVLLGKPPRHCQLHDALVQSLAGHDAPAPPPAWVARPAASAPTGGSGLRVLVAEDNLVNQKVATRLLARVGIRADVVANGLEAVEAVERQAAHGQGYDVVFMDVQMPEMDGLAATRAIRALPLASQPHVVALTANAMEGDREACLEAGADDYLSKPVQLESMRGALASVPSLLECRETAPWPAPPRSMAI